MVIPDQTITKVSGLGANTPGILRRTAERIPDQLKFSATIDATPVRWLPLIVWVAYFPTADSGLPFDQPTHDNWR
jgi:hypothetical protein